MNYPMADINYPGKCFWLLKGGLEGISGAIQTSAQTVYVLIIKINFSLREK
jgi:hypothetical protein